MKPQSQTVPLLDQFLDQNRVSVAALKDFKKTARELIEECKIKSIIHPLLADHVFREAERFLAIIDMFEAHLTSEKPMGSLNSFKNRPPLFWRSFTCY